MTNEYRFAAERQLIFHANVGGKTMLVEFGERSSYGASVFITPDPNIAQAIRRTSMFQRGVIKETTPEEKPAVAAAKKADTATNGKTSLEAAKPAKTTKASQEQPKATNPDNIIEADNFTQAKEIVARRLGIDRRTMKNPASLDKVAKENGLTIHYKEK